MTDSDVAQIAVDAQRTGFQPTESLGASYAFAWKFEHHIDLDPPERLWPGQQVLASAASDKLFMSTMQGNARGYPRGLVKPTPQTFWTRSLGVAPVTGTGCLIGSNYHVADGYGRLWGLKQSDGTDASGWTNPVQVTAPGYPILAHLLYADNKIMFGAMDGIFRAHDPSNGAQLWATQLPQPIIGGAAYSAAAGPKLAVVGCNDGRVYAMNTDTGVVQWSTTVLDSCADFRYYYLMVVGTKVIACPSARYLTYQGQFPSTLQFPSPGIYADVRDPAAQQAALNAYDANPSQTAKYMFWFNLGSGVELAPPIQHYLAGCLNGVPTMPALDRDGYLIMHAFDVNLTQVDVTARFGYARLDLNNRLIHDRLTNPSIPLNGWQNPDETSNASTCANGVAIIHILERNGAYPTNFYNQNTQTFTLFGRPPFPLSSDYVNNTVCGNQLSISGGNGYHNAAPHAITAHRFF